MNKQKHISHIGSFCRSLFGLQVTRLTCQYKAFCWLVTDIGIYLVFRQGNFRPYVALCFLLKKIKFRKYFAELVMKMVISCSWSIKKELLQNTAITR